MLTILVQKKYWHHLISIDPANWIRNYFSTKFRQSCEIPRELTFDFRRNIYCKYISLKNERSESPGYSTYNTPSTANTKPLFIYNNWYFLSTAERDISSTSTGIYNSLFSFTFFVDEGLFRRAENHKYAPSSLNKNISLVSFKENNKNKDTLDENAFASNLASVYIDNLNDCIELFGCFYDQCTMNPKNDVLDAILCFEQHEGNNKIYPNSFTVANEFVENMIKSSMKDEFLFGISLKLSFALSLSSSRRILEIILSISKIKPRIFMNWWV